MPYYYFKNTKTNEIKKELMSISEMEQFINNNKDYELQIVGAPMISSGRGLQKPDSGFRDLLKDMKNKHSKGVSRSTINTF